MKLPTLSRRFWVAFTTVAVIGCLFAYYLLVYVRLREDKLRIDKYRVLARYGENMINTRQDYVNTLDRIWTRARGLIKGMKAEYFNPTTDDETSQLNVAIKNYLLETSTDSLFKVKLKKDLTNAWLKDIRLDSSDRTRIFFRNRRKDFRDSVNDIVGLDFKNVTYDGYLSPKEFDSIQHYHFDRLYFPYRVDETDRMGVFSILTKDFVYRPEQFDEFFIIKQFDHSMHGQGKSQFVAANETFQTFQNRINLHSIDSFLVKERGFLTSHFGEVKFADTRYELFVHSIKLSDEENWLLCGLLEKRNYNYMVRAVDPLVITIAALVLLFLLVAMPILKPLIMNAFERLSIVNVWLAGFSVAYGGALLFLLIWSGSDNLQSIEKIDKELESLSSTVKSRFVRELVSIYRHLNDVRLNQSPDLIKYYDLSNEGRKPSNYENVIYGNFLDPKSVASDSSIHALIKKPEPECYRYFNYLLWIDSSGAPKITVTSQNVPEDYPMPNLKERKYFSRVLHDSLWNLPNDKSFSDSAGQFALQSISSWTDHKPEVGFGLALDSAGESDIKVLAMSTRLSSVMDATLPVGYGFCIIDDNGEVWFHSNTRKNHQENLFLEVEHHGKLTAAVKGRNKAVFSTEYEGHRTRIYVQPINGLPLHLVAFHDKDYQRTPVVLTIFFVVGLIVLLIVVQALQLILLFFCERRSDKVKSKGYFMKVLRPDSKHTDMYQISIFAQAILLIICIGLYRWNCFPTLLGFITLPVMLMVFHQILYRKDEKMDKRDEKKAQQRIIVFSSVSVGLIVVLNLAFSSWLNAHEVTIMVLEQVAFASVLVFFLFSDRILKSLSKKWKLPAPEKESSKVSQTQPEEVDVATLPGTAKDNKGREMKKGPIVWLSKLSQRILKNRFVKFLLTVIKWFLAPLRNLVYPYPTNYYAYLMLLLMLISIFPVIFFYKVAHWQESVLWAKYQQLEAREAMIKRASMVDENFKFLDAASRSTGYPYTFGNYLNTLRSLQGTPDQTGEKFQELLFKTWPRLDDPFAISSAAAYDSALDGAWRWSKSKSGVEISYYEKGSGVKQHYFSGIESFNPLAGSSGPWMGLLILLSLFLMGFVIVFCGKYLFGLGLIPNCSQNSLENIKAKTKPSCRLFVVGLPGSKMHTLKRNDPGISFVTLFELGLTNHPDNEAKLKDLQRLIAFKQRSVVVLSPIQPGSILELYRSWIRGDESGKNENSEEKPGGKKNEYRIALAHWKSILSEFETYYLSIKPNQNNPFPTEIETSELNSCNYLQELARRGELALSDRSDDDFVLTIGEIAEPYYNSLWTSFSPNEKLLLFDLARDGFVNLKNQDTIRILMQKGVIVLDDGAISIMNRSFSSFILNVFRQDEEIALTQKAHSKGSWHDIQIVLVLVIVGIAIFIALAQKELVGNVNAMIVALTGALTMFSKFGGFFNSESKPKQ